MAVRVRVQLIPAEGVSALQLEQAMPGWEKAIETAWSQRYALADDEGHRRPIEIAVVFGGQAPHHRVVVRRHQGRADALHWPIGSSRELLAHEFGHLLGLYDEYEWGATDPAEKTPGTASVMADAALPEGVAQARHYEAFREWAARRTGQTQHIVPWWRADALATLKGKPAHGTVHNDEDRANPGEHENREP